ncbi:unnamed protein product [Angiostrongylus costaricensis]|uniref:HTH_48 domain-containing protein n=1 Tax=Angiostrongylus costaricensis TaxID=334426 RepID=A0A0R3PFB5_ANGCS|nr:unnamed protein product [Angiostrongylus costaricensis]
MRPMNFNEHKVHHLFKGFDGHEFDFDNEEGGGRLRGTDDDKFKAFMEASKCTNVREIAEKVGLIISAV